MSRTALVTSANQGMGCALVQSLSIRPEPHDTVCLAAHTEERGRVAAEALGDAQATVRFAQPDVTDLASISALAEMPNSKHNGVDIVASNAASRISKCRPQSEQVWEFVATDNRGSRALFDALEPLLSRNAR